MSQIGPRFSIVVAAFNAEASIGPCLDSVVAAKNAHDVELIVLDDGSTDRTVEVCVPYAQEFPWIRVITQPNVGVAEVRNRALREAIGEYVAFVDADDTIEPHYFDVIDGKLREPAADMLVFGHNRMHLDGTALSRPNVQADLGREEITRMLERLDPRLSPWVELRTRLHRRFKANRASVERIGDLDAVGEFVYFPLHLEPEMNVHVMGRRFFNQLDAVQALLGILPQGWTVLLKENPKQGYVHRGDAFYRRLRMLPGVRLVADEMPSARLIERSQLVATIVGTAGYEALLAGKACIHFGDAWYAGLPGAFGFDEGLDLATIAACRPEKAALDRGMNALLGKLPDGMAYPRYATALDPEALPATYRATASSMAAISAAVE